jgi:hypothetical protein
MLETCASPLGRKNAPRERDGLFDIVEMGMTENGSATSRERGMAEPPHPEERGYSRGPAKLERACARLEG